MDKLNKESIEINTGEYSEEAEENGKPTSLDPRGKKKKQRKRALPNRSQWTRIVGTLHGSNIPTQRLPTNRAVLQRFDILRDSMPNTSTHVFSELLYNEVLPIWQRANIPVVDKRLCTF